MRRLRFSPLARLRALLAADGAGVRQGMVALLLSSGGDLIAGVTLGSISDTLHELPGLFVLIPAAIGMRGNIFGALGSRLGTLIHTGEFRLSSRLDTAVGQNLAASFLLTMSLSVALAVLAKVVLTAFSVHGAISVGDLIVISVLGGVFSSIVVLLLTIGVAAQSARRNWDLDNVAAPIVTAAGDIVTLPALYLATFAVGLHWVTPAIATVCVVAGIVATVVALRAGAPVLKRIARESLPVLMFAGLVDVIAGYTIEGRLETFAALPALLVLIPPFLEDSGALGGILSARLGSRLHLGTLDARNLRLRQLSDEIALTFMYAIIVFTLVAVSADIVSAIFGLAGPGSLRMIAISLLAGFFATCSAVVVAVGAAVASFRLGLDPDNHGIPLVTSSLDLLGAGSLVIAIVMIGVH
jgi:mgtE-like transporter